MTGMRYIYSFTLSFALISSGMMASATVHTCAGELMDVKWNQQVESCCLDFHQPTQLPYWSQDCCDLQTTMFAGQDHLITLTTLNAPSLFADRINESASLKNGFEIQEDAKVLLWPNAPPAAYGIQLCILQRRFQV